MKTFHPHSKAGPLTRQIVITAWLLAAPWSSQSAPAPATDDTHSPEAPDTAGAAPGWNDVTFAHGTFVAVGSDGAIAVSRDGEGWHPRTSGTATTLRAVTWGADRWIAVGDQGLVLTSSDLLVWQAVATPTRRVLRDVSFAECHYVAVGDGGTILTSDDASAWKLQPSGTVHALRSVTRAWGMFWVGGADRTLLRSKNGRRWSSAMPPGFFGISDLVAEETHLMAAGCGGILHHSREDGRWHFHAVNGAPLLGGLTWGPAGAVAVGQRGTICLCITPREPEDNAWVEVPSGTQHHLEAVAHGLGRYVAVGHADTLLFSTDGRAWRPAHRATQVALREGTRVPPR